MTNSSPQNPQPLESSEPSSMSQEELKRIRQQVRQNVMEEWIAMIVAFGTIGAILFWSLGGKKSNFSPLSQSSFFSSSRQNIETKANLNLDLDSQQFTSTENFADLNITRTPDNTPSEKIIASDSSFIGSLEKSNPNQKNSSLRINSSSSSFPKTVRPTTPKTTIPAPPKAPSLEEIPTEPESESKIETPVISEAGTDVRPSVAADVSAFSDVPEEYWAYPFISKLEAEKLIPDADSFEPDAPITRAGMASLISQAFKDVPSTQTTKNFNDVSSDNNLVADINKAVAIGFLKGYSDENFSPEQNIPRYQVLVALATGLNLEPSNNSTTILQNFSDRKELPEWSLDKVAAATEAGLAINRPSFDSNSLNPNEPATRAEVAAMIYQTLAKSGKVPSVESEYIVQSP